MAIKYWVTAIVADTVGDHKGQPRGREVKIPQRSAYDTVRTAHRLLYLLDGDNQRPEILKVEQLLHPGKRYWRHSSACGNFHVEVFRDGVLYTQVPGYIEDKCRMRRGEALPPVAL